jgi:ABC-type uncharacterized transport system permease subunit
MPDFLFYLITALMYGAIGAYLWRTRWTTAPSAELTPQATGVEHLLSLAPLALHALLLHNVIFVDGTIHFSVGIALLFIVWLTVLIYWLGNLFYHLESLQALVMPVAGVCVLLSALLPPGHPLANASLIGFQIHLLISILAYSLFTIASLHVVLMALQERRIHGARLPVMLQRLPPLLAMETLLFRILWTGFGFLTLTLISGILFSEEIFGRALRFDHKTVFGILSWLIFGALLGGRQLYGWRGRIAMRWTLSGFAVLVLAYIGSKFVLEVILGRT